MAAAALSFEALKSQLDKRQYAPVYLLHGEEGYYIDALVGIFEEILTPEERTFNLYTIYAPETTPDAVMDVCRRYPMMADKQVVILKEAQAIPSAQLNRLHLYASSPSAGTILVICCRGALAKAKDLISQIKAGNGIIFESKRVTEYNVLSVINNYIREKGMSVEHKSLEMLRDYIGTDLTRLHNEIDKLAIVLGRGATITPDAIEQNIGISKDYNNFELVEAVSRRAAANAYRIVEHFSMNPKNNPTVLTCATLFSFFSDLLVLFFCKDKSESGCMKELGMKWPRQFDKFRNGLRNYNAWQTIEIISAIREFDTKSKGIESRQNEYSLLKELIFRIFNSTGRIDA